MSIPTRRAAPPFAEPSGHAEFRAETMSVASRLTMLAFILLAYVLTLALVASAFVWPHGLLDPTPTGAMIVFALLAAAVFGVTLVSLALLANNERIGEEAATWWMWAFILQGPIAIPIYWAMHVWRAPKLAPRDVSARPRARRVGAT